LFWHSMFWHQFFLLSEAYSHQILFAQKPVVCFLFFFSSS
jgi:hypothetical protein